MAFDGRNNIIEMHEDERYIEFDTWSPKKITGHRIGAILGCSRFKTPFAAACEIAGFGYEEPSNKYIVAGNAIEPIVREYCRKNVSSISDMLGLKGPAGVEDPAAPERGGYDHFHTEKLFGGLVDGYILENGKRKAILEIKALNRNRWEEEHDSMDDIPLEYIMQAGLYARLSGLDDIVYAIALLEEENYRVPDKWVSTPENTFFVHKPVPKEMDQWMSECESWYNDYIRSGYTPDWDDERDADLLKYLRAGVKKQNKKKR